MPQLDVHTFPPQPVWLAITFFAFYLLMSRFALPKVGRVIDERKGRVDGDLAEARRMRNEAERILAEYERALAEARATAQASIRETTDRLNAQAAERQAAAARRLAEETAKAEARVDAARSAALANVRMVALDVARQAAARLTGIEPAEDRTGIAVDAALRERG